MRWVADALTYLRVALTLGTYPVALARDVAWFAVLVLLIVITDVLDGPIARRFGTTTARGANLDSVADFFFYASLPLWVYAFAPDAVLSILPYVLVYFVGYVAANLASALRRGVIGFHNRWTRAAGTFGVFFALWTVLWGLNDVVFLGMLGLATLDLAQRFLNIVRAARRPASPPARAAGERDE